jgi:asparaginyl-tRNA synthetase
LRIRSGLSLAIHKFFEAEDFIQIHTPILTSNDCEGAGEMFLVHPANAKISKLMQKKSIHDMEAAYFDQKVYLTVSGQLHLEAICNGLSQVYTFSPAFRAEMGRTRLHLAEFSMIEAEMAFLNGSNMEKLLEIQENLVKSSLEAILTSHRLDIENFIKLANHKRKKLDKNDAGGHLEHIEKVLNHKFIIMSYSEVMQVLMDKNAAGQKIPKYGENFGKENEMFLVEKYCNSIPVFIVDWPKSCKPFYARENPQNDSSGEPLVLASDLIFPQVGELSGGSLRENNYHILKKNIEIMGINEENLKWYLDLRSRGGAAPMGGFGLGFERLIQFMLQIYNIRDCVPFSRSPHNCRL